MNIKDLLGDAYREGMTLSEIEAALDAVSLPEDKTAEVERLTAALSKSNGEAAEYKRQLRAKMTEDEAAKQREADERADLQAKYDALVRESAISKHKAKLVALGYDEKLADETAEAIVDGDMERVIKNQEKNLKAAEQRVRADVLRETPKPVPDGDGNTMTKEKFRGLSPAERYEYSVRHPEEYKQLYTGGN